MRLALISALLLAATVHVSGQPYETPQDLLTAFYEPYFTGDFPEDETQFRSEALNWLYAADAEATPAGEMGALSFDPYVDGQDYELTEFEIGEPVEEAGYVYVDVSFENMGEERSLTYELVEEDGGWKIDDVVSNNPDNLYRLSQIFSEAGIY